MTLEQLCFHFIFTGWLLGTTYQRLVLTNKETNIIALTALRILAVGSVFCFFTPIYLWMRYPNFIQPQIIDGIYWLIWAYIFLIGPGAGVQTVFGLFWGTEQAQKIYSQKNIDTIVGKSKFGLLMQKVFVFLCKPFKAQVIKTEKEAL